MNPILNQLKNEGQIDDDTYDRIEMAERQQLFSVYWHIKTVLYLGVSLLAGGLGILIYKHIDTIGHAAIVALIGLLCAACFFYCIRRLPPFSKQKSESPGMGYDYILLLGCLLFITFLGYLQWQYLVFGSRYGLATFIPAAVLLLVAYRFDHLGVLAMGITLFSSWIGLTITPLQILDSNDFSSSRIIITGISLAILFGAVAWLQLKKDFKEHFSFTYINFAMHLAGVSALSGMFSLSQLIWAPVLAASLYLMYRYSMHERSFYVLLMTVLYGFVGASFLITYNIFHFMPDAISVYLLFAFYIGVSVWLIGFLKRTRKSFQRHDAL